MAEYQAENVPEKNYFNDNDLTYQSNYQGIVQVLRSPQRTAREKNMGVLEIYQFEACTGEPIRDLKGGACVLHLQSGSCSFPALPRPLNFPSNCRCSCSPCPPSPCCPPPCPPSCPPPCPPCYPCPPRPVESCLPGLHQKYRGFYPDCTENHLPSSYRNIVENDDLYLPPRPLSSASKYSNRPTSSRSWSHPSPPPQQKFHSGAAQYQSAQARPGSTWDMHIPESKPCFQTFHASPRGSTPTHPDRSESLYIVETPLQMLPKQPHSRSTSPMQPYLKSCLSPRHSEVKDLINTSCQYSPRIDTDSGPKSFHTQISGVSSPLSPEPSPHNPEPSPHPSSCSLPHYPSGFSEPQYRPLKRFPYVAEVVTVEKHVQCNCSPRLMPADNDQSYTRRPMNPSSYDNSVSVRRILHPESPLRLAPDSRRLECTCHQNPARTSYNQFHYPTLNGSRSQSPSQSSTSTAQHRNAEADLNITTFLNDVKRILTSDVPPRLSPTNRNHDQEQDHYSKLRSTLKPEFPSKEYSSSERTTDRKQENFSSMDFFSKVRSSLKPALPSVDFSSRGRTDQRHDFPSRECVASSGRQDWKQESPSRKARIGSRLEAIDWGQEFPSRDTFSSNGRKADRKQSWDYPSNLDWEYPSGLRATNRGQKYSSCVRTTERGSSPIIMTPLITESGANHGAEIESAERPETAPTLTNPINSEAPRKSRRLQSGNGVYEATKRSSTRTLKTNVSPATESDEDYRYGPIQATPKAAESKHLLKPKFNKQDKSSRFTNREVIRRCCCGMCKSTYSRSHFTTKCPFCANVHSCCCGMCSCPSPSCTSKSPIPDSNTSNSTSTTSSPGNANPHKLHVHNNNPSCSSRPKSLSPMRRTYLAGFKLPDKHRPRSKSTRYKCKIQEKDLEPSPRTLLESFHRYLKLESRRANTSSSPQRRCPERRSTHWKPPSLYPGRNCSQQTKRFSTRKAPKAVQQQQAPWGTHPILLSSKPPNGQALEYRLPYSGSHRGCCCPRCVNGKL
jgi:hypothetical protein